MSQYELKLTVTVECADHNKLDEIGRQITGTVFVREDVVSVLTEYPKEVE